MSIHKQLLSSVAASVLLAGCGYSEWPGPGGLDAKAYKAQAGGYPDKADAENVTVFGGWSNNAYGEDSRLFPIKKDHPPLAGAKVCALELADAKCAISDGIGRFELVGLPASTELHFSLSLRDYMSLLIPFYSEGEGIKHHPALEMPSLAIRNVMYDMLDLPLDESSGGMSFMLVDTPDLLADLDAKDFHESAGVLEAVAVSYRLVNDDGSYGPWSDPEGHDDNKAIYYLDRHENPDEDLAYTSSSGLAIALNLPEGRYQVIADDINKKQKHASSYGFDFAQTDKYYRCRPVNHTPSITIKDDKGREYIAAQTKVVAGHLSDIRIYCQND